MDSFIGGTIIFSSMKTNKKPELENNLEDNVQNYERNTRADRNCGRTGIFLSIFVSEFRFAGNSF